MKRVIFILVFNLLIFGFVYASPIDSNQGIFKSIIPSEFKVGDIQFAIRVENDYNYTVYNIVPSISGKGFSTYDIYPIDSLNPGEKGYILVSGNLKYNGNISLYIKWGLETLYQTVNVIDSEEIERIKQAELENKIKEETLANLSLQLEDFKGKYNILEADLVDKKDNDFDVSKISLDQARDYLTDAETYVLYKDVENAKIKIRLASEEIGYQKIKIESAKPLPYINKFKEYALIFSTIAGALITFFALSELLKRKGKEVVTTVTKSALNLKARELKNKMRGEGFEPS